MKQYLLYIYYLALLLVLMSWTSFTSAPPMPIRLAFLGAVIVPGLIKKNYVLPVALTFFWVMTANGYAYSYMPTSEYLYALVMAVAVLFFCKKMQFFSFKGSKSWVFFFCWVTFVNVVTGFTIEHITYTVLVVLLSFFFIRPEDTMRAENALSVAFMALSIAISYYALTMKNNIMLSVFIEQDRIQWVDPNYMGMQVGMGAVIGLMNCLKFHKLDILQKVLSPVALAMALPCILMTASRGAALGIVGAVFIMTLSTKAKFWYKLAVAVALGAFVVYLFDNAYFDVLLNRIADDNTGSGRGLIWAAKMKEFLDKPWCWVTGCGYDKAIRMGAGRLKGYDSIVGFHNDYIAVLCTYGIVGLVVFLRMLISPLTTMKKANVIRFEIYTCIVYSMLCFLTLEPLTAGRIAFYVFMIYTQLKAHNSHLEEERIVDFT